MFLFLLRGVIGDFGERLGRAGADGGTDGEANRGEEAGRADPPDYRARDRGGVRRRSQFGPDPAAGEYGWA
jgi:hypothetical protein